MPLKGYQKAIGWFRRQKSPAPSIIPIRDLSVRDDVPRPVELVPPQVRLDDLAAVLSWLTGRVQDLASLSDRTARMAWSNASLVNHNISNADNAVTAVEILAKKVSELDRQIRVSGNGHELDALQVRAMDAVKLSFAITVQMVHMRSSAKQLVEALETIQHVANEVQELAEALQHHVDGGCRLGSDCPDRLSCCG